MYTIYTHSSGIAAQRTWLTLDRVLSELGFRILDLKFRFRAKYSGFRVHGSGFRPQGSGFRV